MKGNKIALILEGGAMRGAFAKGVLDCFKQNNMEFPYIIGVSAGAITGFEFASGINFDINKLFGSFSQNMELLKNSSEPLNLVEMVENVFSLPEEYNVKDSFEVSAVSLLDGSVRYFSLSDKNDMKFAIDRVIASSSLPDMAKPVVIDNIPYYDGGMYNTNPIDRAIELGYEKFVVVLTKNRGYRRENSNPSEIVKNALRDFPKFLETMCNEKERYNNSLNLIDDLENKNKAVVLAPVNPLKFKSFTTNTQDVIDLYKEGYQLALQKIEEVKKLF